MLCIWAGALSVCEQHQQSFKKIPKCLKTVFASRYETINLIGIAHFFLVLETKENNRQTERSRTYICFATNATVCLF